MHSFDLTGRLQRLRTCYSIDRIVDRLLIVILASLVGVGACVYSGFVSSQGKVCNDFAAIYVAGSLAVGGRFAEAYDVQAFSKALASFCGTAPQRMPWTYPPPFNLIAGALSLLPYGLSYLVFISVSLIAFMMILRRLCASLDHYNLARITCLPSMGITIIAGQNGLLTAALIGLFTLFILSGRRSASLPLGLLIIKPQLATGLALLVLMQKRVRLLIFTLIVVLSLSLLTTVLMGADVWRAFAHAAGEAGAFLKNGEYQLSRMTSIYAAAFSITGSASIAFTLQIFVAVLCSLAIYHCVRLDLPLRPLLGVSILLSYGISPYVYDYDCVAYGVSAALIAPYIFLYATVRQKLPFLVLSWLPQLYGAYFALFAADGIRDLVSIRGKPVSIGGVVFIFLAGATLFSLINAERKNVSGP